VEVLAERADDVQELHRGAGPAVGEDQRQGMGIPGAYVEEVHPVAVQLGDLLGQCVELGLVGAPVERQPVLGEGTHPVEGDAVRVGPAGPADGPASQAALGRRTGIYLSDLVGALNDLETAGYVQRSPDPADRRRNVVAVTAAGRERAGELTVRVEAIQDDLLAPLSGEERARFAGLLRRLVEHHSRTR
jgi:DNA-binding MarR family transcriptional regulator